MAQAVVLTQDVQSMLGVSQEVSEILEIVKDNQGMLLDAESQSGKRRKTKRERDAAFAKLVLEVPSTSEAGKGWGATDFITSTSEAGKELRAKFVGTDREVLGMYTYYLSTKVTRDVLKATKVGVNNVYKRMDEDGEDGEDDGEGQGSGAGETIRNKPGANDSGEEPDLPDGHVDDKQPSDDEQPSGEGGENSVDDGEGQGNGAGESEVPSGAGGADGSGGVGLRPRKHTTSYAGMDFSMRSSNKGQKKKKKACAKRSKDAPAPGAVLRRRCFTFTPPPVAMPVEREHKEWPVGVHCQIHDQAEECWFNKRKLVDACAEGNCWVYKIQRLETDGPLPRLEKSEEGGAAADEESSDDNPGGW